MTDQLIIDDRYLLEAEVGAGGMGTVYRAMDRDAGRLVAVKLLHRLEEEDRARFEREVKLLASLSHPAIVRYLDHGVTSAGAPYLVTEWVEGESLRDHLERHGLGLATSVEVCRRLADAVAVAHRAGVVHRDLKPENVLFEAGAGDSLKLIDFGIARRTSEARALTRTGTVMGTLGFLSPEQARGERAADPRIDVFALGCILYLCITGRLPFAGESLAAVQAKVLFYEPPVPSQQNPEVPEALDRLVLELIDKDPDRRPPDAGAVAEALSRLDELPDEPVIQLERGTSTTRDIGPRTEQESVAVLFVAAPSRRQRRRGVAVEPTPAARAIADDHRAELVALAGGAAVIFVRDNDPDSLAERAARMALALRAAVPALAMSLSCQLPGGDAGEAIERGARTLRTGAMRGILGGARADAVEIDEDTARRIGGRFPIRRQGDSWLLGPTAD